MYNAAGDDEQNAISVQQYTISHVHEKKMIFNCPLFPEDSNINSGQG